MKKKREPATHMTAEAQGFTLIEMMIALFILSVGILGLLAVHMTTTKTNFKAGRMTTAATENADRHEKLLAVDYDDVATTTTVDGRYTTTWTVSAAGVPIPNVKTVTIKTAWKENGQDRSIQYVYYKAKSF
jgi:prepilin-type N-terminal cleavage/methylation domain-containing protein